MKFTIQEAQDLLIKAGVPAVEIVEKDSDYNEETALTQIDETRKAIFKPILEADLEKTIQKKFDGKVGGALSSILARTFGMTVSEFEGLKDDDKIKKALEKHDEKFGQDAEGLRKAMEDLEVNFRKDKEAVIKEKDAQIAAEKEKYIYRDIIEKVAEDFKTLPLPQGADRQALAKLYVEQKLKPNYALNYDEAQKKLTLGTKDNPAMPVYTNGSNTTFKSPIDDAKEFFEPLSLWVKDMRNEKLTPHVNQNNNNPNINNQQQLSPLEKINAQVLDHIKSQEVAA